MLSLRLIGPRVRCASQLRGVKIESDVKLSFKDVLVRPKRSTLKSRSEVDLERTVRMFHNPEKTWTGIPIVAANMDTIGTFEMARTLSSMGILTAVHKHYSLQQWEDFIDSVEETQLDNIMVSSGTSDANFQHLKSVFELHDRLDWICIDVANGYSEHFINFVREVRDAFPESRIVAGNVVTGEIVEQLLLSGADVVKVGIGPGSVCTTRVKTGVGYPQLSAVMECADSAHGIGGHIMSDGGCTCPGDVAKAFGGGADFVMLGGMLSGCDESGGEVIELPNGKKVKEFYGMSSAAAMDRHAGGVANYRAAEGKLVHVPYRGPVTDVVLDALGGIRSACTYVGARRLKELTKRTTFVRVREQENRVFGKDSSVF
ncbi:MAG: hypothetical protein MHM6MM_000157 [Cercozoa sp. M6MM]